MFNDAAKRGGMPPLHPLHEAIRRASVSEHIKKTEAPDEGQLRYWTNEMCTKSPDQFDFVVTVRNTLRSCSLY